MPLPAGPWRSWGFAKQAMFEKCDLPSHKAENPVRVLVSGWVSRGCCVCMFCVRKLSDNYNDVTVRLNNRRLFHPPFPELKRWSKRPNMAFISCSYNGTQEPFIRAFGFRTTLTGNRKYLLLPENQSKAFKSMTAAQCTIWLGARSSMTPVIKTQWRFWGRTS